ncbi:hypothetical protein SESBI_34006 [Sesbania bispinosa]|nr:hypothetical protein SESBI_34006 [Sesbania bispinosa]
MDDSRVKEDVDEEKNMVLDTKEEEMVFVNQTMMKVLIHHQEPMDKEEEDMAIFNMKRDMTNLKLNVIIVICPFLWIMSRWSQKHGGKG